MKKILVVLCLYAITAPTYSATICAVIRPARGEDTTTGAWIQRTSTYDYYYCGEHTGDDYGCPNAVDIYTNFGPSGPGFYTCYSNIPKWSFVEPTRWIADCANDPVTDRNARDQVEGDPDDYVFFYNYDVGESAKNICKFSRSELESYTADCESTGGEKNFYRYRCLCRDPYENDGPYKCKLKPTKFNYKSCSSDSDCTGIDNTVRPYLHSTAWHCAWQSAGVRVCTATACENGWTPINGYCQEDKNTQTPQPENEPSTSNVKTETKTTVKKTCTDLANMNSNCNCVVPETVVRDEKCVCSDGNKEIKNGRCEWTAKYIAGLESDLDSKFNNLTATIGGFEKNVWRDENGEFNTARLASDSIAGIVLGTVGGIVTANLVKKAQVKKGFEDIGCYIGGQSVAGFGDEFNVGR
jgi:hypothetical protein